MTTRSEQPVMTDSEKLEAVHLPRQLRRQVVAHLASIKKFGFGELTLVVEKGHVRFVRPSHSEDAAG